MGCRPPCSGGWRPGVERGIIVDMLERSDEPRVAGEAIVYRLFDLTSEEIALLESSLTGRY